RWLLLTLRHHLTSDHESQEVLQEEISAHLRGRESELPAPLPFRNYVAQARLGVSREEHERFFRGMLGDVEEPTAPYGLLDVHGGRYEIGEAWLPVARDLGARLRRRARALGVGAASLCHLAWAQVLARLSGRADVVFGTVLFGRMQGGEGADRVMGPFINTLPVRIGAGEEGVEAAVRRTHALLADLLRHEHASLALAQRCSGVAAPAPLFTSLLNYRYGGGRRRSQDAGQAREGVRGIRAQERTNYPVVLSVDDLGEDFSLSAQVAAPADAERVCRMMHTALARLIEALEVSPGRAIGSIDVLPDAERALVLEAWNRTAAEYLADRCLHELFEAQVERTPGAVAVVFEDATLTYGELDRRANRLAHQLIVLGVRAEDRVALCVEPSPDAIAALLGILKAGAAYVATDLAGPDERIAFMLDEASVRVVVAGGVEAARPWMAGRTVVEASEDLARFPGTSPAVWVTPRNLAYVVYTSGSTGLPKGVLVEHGGVCNAVTAFSHIYEIAPGHRVLLFAPLHFDASVMDIFTALTTGAALVVAPREALIPGDELVSLLEREGVTHAKFTPSALAALPYAPLPALRAVMVGGEVCGAELVARWAPGRRFFNGYGPTETSVRMSVFEATDGTRPPPLGAGTANVRVYVLDAAGEPLPVGVPGEVCIGGVQVTRGYLARPALTAERFVPDPFSAEPGARLYRSGDRMRWRGDGTLEFVGRIDHQVKIRGFRIELGEIEGALRRSEGVDDCVVVAREDVSGEKRLVAYVVGDVGAGVLRDRLRRILPEYMVPAAFVVLEALPLTANGKLNRKALPAPEYAAEADRYVAPRTPTEEVLAGIWAEVLRLERVGVTESFFDLGGHSLLIMRLLARIQATFDLEISIRTVFSMPVLEAMAGEIERRIYEDAATMSELEAEQLAQSNPVAGA
ncbi:MAG TPA: amino acid adenylation domain-containing protein, partial [Longimicrobium sp.]|nr:amino acid adenylation domain-containing protein [Longimicrobium sp.]